MIIESRLFYIPEHVQILLACLSVLNLSENSILSKTPEE